MVRPGARPDPGCEQLAARHHMRVAYVYDLVYPFSKGGVEKRIALFSRGLAERGHDVHVFGTKHWDGLDHIVTNGVTVHGIAATRRLHLDNGRRSIWQGIAFASSLSLRLFRERFDIIDVQASAPLTCLATLAVGRLRRIPTLVTWHEVWGRSYWTEYLGWAGLVGSLVERSIARFGRHHAVVSQTTADRLALLGVQRARLLPNGVDTSKIRAGGGTSVSGIVYVGRIAGHKNVQLLIDAARRLIDQGVDPSILIVGDGPQRGSLEKTTNEMPNLRFLGEIESEDELWSTVKSARVFALPSLREGFGLAVLEAMACGVPVVTTDHADNAASELVESGVNGFVVAANPNDFARALKEILTDDHTHHRLAENARRTAEAFSMDRVVDNLVSAYQEITAGNGSGHFNSDSTLLAG